MVNVLRLFSWLIIESNLLISNQVAYVIERLPMRISIITNFFFIAGEVLQNLFLLNIKHIALCIYSFDFNGNCIAVAHHE